VFVAQGATLMETRTKGNGLARASIDVLTFWRDVLAPNVARLGGESWRAWQVALRALFALTIDDEDRELYRRATGRRSLPGAPAKEGWFIVGRRGGKSYVMALLAVYLATVRRYELAPGERGVLMVIASDRRQARVVRRYVGALLRAVPMLAQLVVRETSDAVVLSTGVDIEIHTSSYRAVRGYTVVGAICDEIAFWPHDDAADADAEVLAALRPAMATTDGLMLAISSPYARRGALYEAHRSCFGVDDSETLVWVADTQTMNPTVDPAVIARAFRDDDTAAWSEYGRDGEIRFRADVEGFITAEAIEAATVAERRELPPVAGVSYVAFLDFAGGSGGDSSTLAVAHREEHDGQAVAYLDAVREVRPPFSPDQVCADFARLLKCYRVTSATADRYAADWPVERMARHGVRVTASERTKSAIYKEVLPLINSGLVSLLDISRLRAQLASLERRVARGGRDSIDHAPGAHDDVANAACGALVAALAASRRRRGGTWGRRQTGLIRVVR
jgi:hypothetical protein